MCISEVSTLMDVFKNMWNWQPTLFINITLFFLLSLFLQKDKFTLYAMYCTDLPEAQQRVWLYFQFRLQYSLCKTIEWKRYLHLKIILNFSLVIFMLKFLNLLAMGNTFVLTLNAMKIKTVNYFLCYSSTPWTQDVN